MVAGPLTAVSQGNTYIVDHAASGKLVIEFSRNPNEFALPNYIQMRKVDKQKGYYLRIDQYAAARLVGSRVDDYLWNDGMDRPQPNNEGFKFQWDDYQTVRRNINDRVGDLAAGQADFDVVNIQSALQAHKAMLLRTQLVVTALNTSGNWDSTHWQTVTALPGVAGTWDSSLSSNQYIRKSINYAVNLINKDTVGKVKKKDLRLVMNPVTASALGATQELIDVIKQSPDALGQLTQGTGKWSDYGLPSKLYGCEIVVEDAVVVTSGIGAASLTNNYVMPDGAVWLLARPGSLESKAGGPSFSTVMLFAKEEMTVETTKDQYNRYTKVDVVDDVGVAMTAPVAGFAFRGVLS